jgi:hypothetical protein
VASLLALVIVAPVAAVFFDIQVGELTLGIRSRLERRLQLATAALAAKRAAPYIFCPVSPG